MPERLPYLGLCIKERGVAARAREKHQTLEREHQKAREKKRLAVYEACVVNRDCVIAVLNLVCSAAESILWDCVNILGYFHRCQRALLHCAVKM